MSFAQRAWSSTGSTLSPMIFVFRLSNSGLRLAMYPSSVVHTGVKSLGCENRTAHDSPIHSWKRIRPMVVSAMKSGATSPILRPIDCLLFEFAADVQDCFRYSPTVPFGGTCEGLSYVT